MDAKDFFIAVAKLRRLQKKYQHTYNHDEQLTKDCRMFERRIDREIARVEKMRELQKQPRLF